MGIAAPAVLDALAAVVGKEFVRDDPATRASHAVDGIAPRWVAFPGTACEVSELVAIAAEERLALTPWGSGTLRGLGNIPARLDLALDLRRLASVVDYAPDDLTVTVGAGAILGALSQHLGARRQFLPLDPLHGPGRTIGGVLATNGSGPLRFRYGTGRDLLLGVRFVQADGSLTWGGAKVVKSVTGYDMPRIMVGALGTLGVLVELTLRLYPLPETERSWLIRFDRMERAGEFLERVLDSALQPSRIELMNGQALGLTGPGKDGAFVALSVGSVAEAVASQGEAALGLARAFKGEGRELAHDFWSGLGRAVHEGKDEHTVVLKVTTPLSHLGLHAAEIEAAARALGLNVALVAEAGCGVLHVRLGGTLTPDGWDCSVVSPWRDRLGSVGGSCVLEEAPPVVKKQLDVWGPVDPAVWNLMKRLKHAFDPQSLLNPGRFVGRL